MRDLIDSELVGEERAVEFLKTLPRLEEDYKRLCARACTRRLCPATTGGGSSGPTSRS
jgi:hypothetical protein